MVANFLLILHGRIENDTFSRSSFVACVLIAAVKFLPSRCLATVWEIHIRTQTDERDIFKYAVVMGSGAMI
jgi:hypothetical protein